MTNEFYQDKLESERLITRKLTDRDVKIWADFFSDKEAVEFFPKNEIISHSEKSKEWITRQINRYRDNTYGLQALINKQNNDFIGQCGLLLQEVDEVKELEVGYHIIKKYWGQGFAPEAARLFIDYAFENNLADSLIAIIDKRNLKSKRVAEKNGLQVEKQTIWNNIEVEIFRITKGQH